MCDNCGITVPPASGTFRNHCHSCLASKHVDGDVPGDRAASCGGIMLPIAVSGSDPDQFDITHQCQQCKHQRNNKVASDDDRLALTALVTPPPQG